MKKILRFIFAAVLAAIIVLFYHPVGFSIPKDQLPWLNESEPGNE